jgi:hypothetical protein
MLWADSDTRTGYMSPVELQRRITILVRRSLTEKPKLSNSTLTGLSPGNMTVSLCSRDAEGDAGKRPAAGRARGAAGGLPSLSPRSKQLGPLGSRFWALADEFSDEEGQGAAELEVGSAASEISSPSRSKPAQRTLADFLGEEWSGVFPAGCRSSGDVSTLVSAAVQAGEMFPQPPCLASSPALRDPVSWAVGDFPPLPRSVALAGAAASSQVLVGSLPVPLLGCSPVTSSSPPAARSAPSGPRVGDAGDVASSLPSVPLGVVAPTSQCPLPVVSASADTLPGPAHVSQVGICARPGPSVQPPYK